MKKEENISEILVKSPSKTLPVTGVPVAGIRKYAELPSRAPTERDLLTFISGCMSAEKVYGCVIKAWWGEGKTDAYENLIKLELEKRQQLNYDVIATTIARVFEKRQKEGSSDPVVWRAFLAALFESIWEEKKSRPKEVEFLQREEKESDFDYIQRIMQKLSKISQRAFIFIDEVEQLEPRPSRDDILLGIRGLFDQKEEFVSGKLHLIMACTPDAFNRFIGSFTQMGGLLDRLKVVELPRPTEEEAVKFVYGLINYLYEGKLPDNHPFINSGPAYAVMYAGHRSPRSMIKALQQVFEYAKHLVNKNGYLRRIDGWVIIEALKDYNLSIFGTQVFALDGDLLERILDLLSVKGEPERTEKIRRLICLLIGEPIPHHLEELSLRLNISEEKIKELIGIANNRANESGLLDRWLVLPVGETKLSINNLPEELRDFFLRFVFCDDSGNFVSRSFLPIRYQALMGMSIDINLDRAQKLASRLSSYCSDTNFYLISSKLIERIYPNPDFLELAFITDKNKRLELWKEAYERINERGILSQIESSLLDLLKSLEILVERQ
jgi:hypothetical protein